MKLELDARTLALLRQREAEARSRARLDYKEGGRVQAVLELWQ